MRAIVAALTILAASMASATGAPLVTLVSSTFDTSAEGWTAVGDVSSFSHQAAGGNPGGRIAAVDAAQGPIIYFVAPAAYHGDLSKAFGGQLGFDLHVTSGPYTTSREDVTITGGGTTLSWDIANPATGVWTSYSTSLDDAGGWKVGDRNGPAATNAQILAVLSSVTDFQIRAEYINGADTGSLDNVEISGVVPVPAGGVLMLSGLALAAGARRWRR